LNTNNILSCSCGLKDRYGIPCRHLFCIEPEYDIGDIDFRYQIAYAYYAYHPNHAGITKCYKTRALCEHAGIRQKNRIIRDNLPFLSTSKHCTLGDMQHIKGANIPICWNYQHTEYPPCYVEGDSGAGDFTQEYVALSWDSDGVFAAGDDQEVNSDTEEVDVDNGKVLVPVHDANVVDRRELLNDGQLLTKFKTVMSYHKGQQDKRCLWEVLSRAEDNQRQKLLSARPALIGTQDGEMISLHLPIDKAAESIRHTNSPGSKDGKPKGSGNK
jgi:hypothetical protein